MDVDDWDRDKDVFGPSDAMMEMPDGLAEADVEVQDRDAMCLLDRIKPAQLGRNPNLSNRRGVRDSDEAGAGAGGTTNVGPDRLIRPDPPINVLDVLLPA